MNEQDILNLIKDDEWMMSVLKIAEELNFPNWVIGAGFIRNKVWDHLHGFSNIEVDTNDIDLVYFDPGGNDQKTDERLSQELTEKTGIKWEIVNEVYAHGWNKHLPYKSIEDALSKWSETATSIGVRLSDGKLTLIAPHGIIDLVDLVIRPCPEFTPGFEKVKERAESKRWIEKWPKLKFASD